MISIFGIILILSMSFYIIKNLKNENLGKNLYFISIVSLLVLDIGYIAKIGSFTLEYNYFFSIINFVFTIYYFLKNRKNLEKKDIIIIFSFLLLILFSLLFPLVFNLKYNSVAFNDSWDSYFGTNKELKEIGFSKHSLGMYARVIIFILSTYVFSKSLEKDDIKKYSNCIYNISWFIIGISLIEFIITNFIDNFAFRHFAFFLFGRSAATYELPRITFGGIFAPMAFMREPSSYVRALFIIGINNVFVYINSKGLLNKERIKIIANIVIVLFLIALSKSLSGYIYIIGINVIIWDFIKNKKIKLSLAIVSSIFIIIICILLHERIQKVFGAFSKFNMNPNSLPAQSELIRFYSINNNIQLFLHNLLLGCGFGTVYCYSSVITLLTNIGIIGVGVYIYIINYITNISIKEKFFSWLTFIVVIITGFFIGHMSYITYLENFAYEIIILKSIDHKIKQND